MNFEFLRSWKRSQLLLLKQFIKYATVNQEQIAMIGGFQQSSHSLGGQLTSLSRAHLIVKAGRDKNGQFMWQLNQELVNKNQLQKFLKDIDI